MPIVSCFGSRNHKNCFKLSERSYVCVLCSVSSIVCECVEWHTCRNNGRGICTHTMFTFSYTTHAKSFVGCSLRFLTKSIWGIVYRRRHRRCRSTLSSRLGWGRSGSNWKSFYDIGTRKVTTICKLRSLSLSRSSVLLLVNRTSEYRFYEVLATAATTGHTSLFVLFLPFTTLKRRYNEYQQQQKRKVEFLLNEKSITMWTNT